MANVDHPSIMTTMKKKKKKKKILLMETIIQSIYVFALNYDRFKFEKGRVKSEE